MLSLTLTSVPGVLVGHAEDAEHTTGCTAVLCPEGFTPGVCVPGFAPGSRELELLRPESLVNAVHGIVLSGGSAFGLAAADGVVRHLVEQDCGFLMPHARIPLVAGAVIYDLDGNSRPGVLPDAAMGYAAARAADASPVRQGRVGAGTGARCGRLFSMGEGPDRTSPGGLGSAGMRHGPFIIAALVVVNALGNVHDPRTGRWLAGGVDDCGRPLPEESLYAALAGDELPVANTVLAVVATNARLDKAAVNRLARMAAAGLPRSIRPAHLTYDGDVVFALSAGNGPDGNENLLGALGAEAVAAAAAAAVRR